MGTSGTPWPLSRQSRGLSLEKVVSLDVLVSPTFSFGAEIASDGAAETATEHPSDPGQNLTDQSMLCYNSAQSMDRCSASR